MSSHSEVESGQVSTLAVIVTVAFKEGWLEMLDEPLKEYRKRLESAVNDALAWSSQVSAKVRDIRGAGYQAFLVIGFNRLPLTPQDKEFLKSLNIRPDETDSNSS